MRNFKKNPESLKVCFRDDIDKIEASDFLLAVPKGQSRMKEAGKVKGCSTKISII